MSKSHVEELKLVYTSIFEDAKYTFPTLGGEFEMDLTRLLKSVEQRGVSVFVTDLPALGKHLDRCLSDGEYKLSGLPLSKRYSNRVVIPKFLRGLYLLVFNEHGCLKGDYSIEAIIFLRQILSGAKKATLQCSSDRIVDEINDFISTDKELPEPEKFWSLPTPSTQDVSETYLGFGMSTVYSSRIESLYPSNRVELSNLLTNLDLVSGLVASTLGSYDFNDWKFRHGPGAISERTGPTNKYSWSNWSDRLENVFPIADCGFHNYCSWAGSVDISYGRDHEIASNEPFSRLVDVPKSYTKPRLIAVEPSEHQWCQQNIWHYFRTRTEKSWLSAFILFGDQTQNQRLCMLGSEEGTLSTVDLSAASDRVSCHAVGQFFRGAPSLLLALQATRTRFVKQTQVHYEPCLLELRKFSTMGNACTFPVESLMFLSVALASIATKRKMPVTLANIKSLIGEVTVFGDDIIIPTDSRELLFEALEVLHFKVNLSKSFWTGRFRESCGVDAFAGVDVTPAYWRSPTSGAPESIASKVEVSNNFYSKFFVKTSSFLASTIRGFNIPLVTVDSGVCGFRSFVKPDPSTYKVRWNKFTQVTETLVPMLETKAPRSPVADDSAVHQYFTESPSPLTKWKSGIQQRPRLKIKTRWVPLHLLTSR